MPIPYAMLKVNMVESYMVCFSEYLASVSIKISSYPLFEQGATTLKYSKIIFFLLVFGPEKLLSSLSP